MINYSLKRKDDKFHFDVKNDNVIKVKFIFYIK